MEFEESTSINWRSESHTSMLTLKKSVVIDN